MAKQIGITVRSNELKRAGVEFGFDPLTNTFDVQNTADKPHNKIQGSVGAGSRFEDILKYGSSRYANTTRRGLKSLTSYRNQRSNRDIDKQYPL